MQTFLKFLHIQRHRLFIPSKTSPNIETNPSNLSNSPLPGTEPLAPQRCTPQHQRQHAAIGSPVRPARRLSEVARNLNVARLAMIATRSSLAASCLRILADLPLGRPGPIGLQIPLRDSPEDA